MLNIVELFGYGTDPDKSRMCISVFLNIAKSVAMASA